MDLLHVGAMWLHEIAAVVLLGYYGMLALVFLPALRRTVVGPALGEAVESTERRARPWLIASVVIFLATGVYLLATDPRFTGIGALSNSWSLLILAKHGLVIAMLVLGALMDWLLAPDVALAGTEAERAHAFGRVLASAAGMTVLGAIVLLLTAAAQGS